MVDNQGTHLEGAGKGTANDLKRAERAAAARAKAAEDANTGDSNAGEVSDTNVCFTTKPDEDTNTIDPKWLLLDSESNVHIFCDPDLVSDLHLPTDGETLRLLGTGGTQDSNWKAKFGDMAVWFNAQSLANILSLSKVAEHFRVTMDTFIDNSFTVHLNDGMSLKFTCHDNGLYYCDTSKLNTDTLHQAFSFFSMITPTDQQQVSRLEEQSGTKYSFLQSVEDNMKQYRHRDVQKAIKARQLSRLMCHPEQSLLIRMIKDNSLQNCTITPDDVRRAEKIFGKSIPATKGRTRRQTIPRVESNQPVEIPVNVYEDNKNVTLCADFFYVNGIAVFHAISRKLNHRYVSFPQSRSRAEIIKSINDLDKIYSARGLRVHEIHADPEFKKVNHDVLPIHMRYCGAGEHVPEVERSVQTVKNGCRAQSHSMPYKRMPLIMIKRLIHMVTMFLNATPPSDSYNGVTPRNIVDGLPHLDCNHLQYEFGSYVQLYIQEQITNTMRGRTIDAIVLDPTDDGKYNFLSLETGKMVDGRVKEVLPITQRVIDMVEAMGGKQGQPLSQSRMLAFEWRPGQSVSIDDIFPEHQLLQRILPTATTPVLQTPPQPLAQDQGAQEVNDLDQGAQEAGNDETGNEFDQGAQQADIDQGAQQADITQRAPADCSDRADHIQYRVEDNIQYEENETVDTTMGSPSDEETDDTGDNDADDGITEDTITERRKAEKERRKEHFRIHTGENYGRGKRTRRQKLAFSFLQKKYQKMNQDERKQYARAAWKDYETTKSTKMLEECITGFVFAQMSAKQGRKKYGVAADRKLLEEFQQLLDYSTFIPRKYESLSPEAKRTAAGMINIIEEKINRGHTDENPVLKGRSCYDGRGQRYMYTKEETASPTVSTDAFFLTLIADALERRDVAMADVGGAYLNAEMIDEVIMKIKDEDLDLFCQLRPDYKEYIVQEGKSRVLYVQLNKALYGCVKSALLWYNLFTETLEDMGFTVNPYDMCVANAEINGKQCTITWYVDDTKISHVDPRVVDDIIKKLRRQIWETKNQKRL
jgi:Reverse transcriptase (RNA-dependent DNA polymerase).